MLIACNSGTYYITRLWFNSKIFNVDKSKYYFVQYVTISSAMILIIKLSL